MLDRRLSAGDTRGVEEDLDRLERGRGASAGTRYLRARAALLRGNRPPAAVAQTLSQLVDEDGRFHEASLQAARAWLAAGETGRARYYARRIVEDSTATDNERLVGLEILEATSATSESHAPPAVHAVIEGPSETQMPAAPRDAARARAALSHARHRPPAAGRSAARDRRAAARRRGGPGRGAGAVRYNGEIVESLALPLGASESLLGLNELPTTGAQARVAMTRLARDLARDYRLWYAKTLRCNVMAVEAMQQHLAQPVRRGAHRRAGGRLGASPSRRSAQRDHRARARRRLVGHRADASPATGRCSSRRARARGPSDASTGSSRSETASATS